MSEDKLKKADPTPSEQSPKSVYGKKILRVSDPWLSSKEIMQDERIQREAKEIVRILLNDPSKKERK